MNQEIVFRVSDFVEYFNQTIEYAYGNVLIEGEVSSFRISKNKWVYFDLKDENSSVKFFGSIFSLPGPIEDGMLARVVGTPRLHNLYGFSVNFKSISLVGQGSIKKAADLLRIKLKKEGLFEESRKRILPTIPKSIGLITSNESAAYKDFIKILENRWSGLSINLYNVGVQGIESVEQNLLAIEHFNSSNESPDIIVITRGGGSKDDLSIYDDERVVRAVANSKIPTLVAVGHEIDVSLAELVADMRASTPSNAAEILTPDKKSIIVTLANRKQTLYSLLTNNLKMNFDKLISLKRKLESNYKVVIDNKKSELVKYKEILRALSPQNALTRGYAIIRDQNGVIKSVKKLKIGQNLSAELFDGSIDLEIKNIEVK